ncbi:MAG TPA: ATPase, T2SS/T4P/T4SS family [Phycisphaerales bacterium]|nr:ATPase, T2SS/T4P/T4SS family [Phycisphaerales bacterium]HMP37806.1 ATPase, T2SS/T4P/T4SS family [Phycisphaerales bacterium]
MTFVDAIPHDFARLHLISSDGLVDGAERLVVGPATDALVVHNVSVRLQRPCTVRVEDPEAVARAVDALYERARRVGQGRDAADGTIGRPEQGGDLDRLLVDADRDLLNTQGKGRVIKLVDGLLFEAAGRGASDLHIQPLADRTLVRYRIDGVLHDVRELGAELAIAVVSRIKVMGRMDIAERRMPQDGRATVNIGRRPIDLRISTLPTSYGERAVLRLLDTSQQLCAFERLGMPERIAGPFLDRAGRSSGIILVTGPTGSGKTTTLYSTLRQIGSSQVNIMTIEDPIEYELSTVGLAISQAQVNARKGVTFATGLRHILRQDPDIVMVGEIRDEETARTAIQSSLTGHLVLSSLHTNDAASAVSRLLDLGVEPFLVSASLSAVLAQRLVRVIHRECAGAGCDLCMGTGLRGRTGVFELLIINDALRALINDRADAATIRASATASGMATLVDEGRRLVDSGGTTDAEVRRVLLGVL